jgi:thioredoxin reductase
VTSTPVSDRPHPPGDYPVVVVGTGPGGLQLSYELRRIGVRHALISEDEGPGGMFRRFPLFHRLNTSSRRFAVVPRDTMAFYRYDWNSLVSETPGHRALVPEFMDGEHYFPRRSEMADALAMFAERAAMEARYGCRWESTRQEADGRFVLGTTDGEYRSEIAVFAVGMSEPWRPETPGLELVPHYDDLRGREAESFAGKRVFIIGKRNSAFEIADALLPWAAQLILGSPHHVRPSIVTSVPTPPRARYLEVFEDHLFGGGSFVVDCAIERIERTADGWRVHAEGTTEPGAMVFEVDEVIATTGFGTPLGDLRELGVQTFYKDRLPTQTPFWESTSVPGVFFAGAATQGQVGLRKYGFPTGSASVGGFRYNACVQAVEIGRRLGIEPNRPQLEEGEVASYLLEQATLEGSLWRQQAHLARVVGLDPAVGIRDEGILPIAPFVDSAGPPSVAIVVETEPGGNLQPCVYVRRDGRVSEHQLPPAFLHDFRTPEHRAELESLLGGLVRQTVA